MNYFFTTGRPNLIIPRNNKGLLDFEGIGINKTDLGNYGFTGNISEEVYISVYPISDQGKFNEFLLTVSNVDMITEEQANNYKAQIEDYKQSQVV